MSTPERAQSPAVVSSRVPRRADAASGITGCVRIGDFVLCGSNVDELEGDDEAYRRERSEILALDEICGKRRLTPVLFDVSEFSKSGASLSSLVMHLNHANLFLGAGAWT